MRVLVFRPRPDAERTAASLRARGHEPIVAPLFSVVTSGEPVPAAPFDALVVTSANALPALAAHSSWRDLPLYAVGYRSAAAARAQGFLDTRSAGGDRHDLVELIRRTLGSGASLLLALGADRHDDVAERLSAAGYAVTVWTAYSVEPVAALPPAAAGALRDGTAEAALHYSPRGAGTFLRLAEAAGLGGKARGLAHVALSQEVGAALSLQGAVAAAVAATPDEQALLAVLDQRVARLGGSVDARDETSPAETPGTSDRDGMSPPKDRASRRKAGDATGDPAVERKPPTLDLTAETVAVEPSAGSPEAMVKDEAPPAEPSGSPAEPIVAAIEAAPPPASVERPPAPEPAPAASEPSTPAATTPRIVRSDEPSAPSPPTREPIPERRRLPVLALGLAGLVGGLLGAALILFGLGRGEDRTAADAAAAAKLAAMEKQVADVQAASRQAIEASDRRAAAAIEAAEKRAAALSEAAEKRAVEAGEAAARATAAATEVAQRASAEAQANARRLAELAAVPTTPPSALTGVTELAQRAEAEAAAARAAAGDLGRQLTESSTRLGTLGDRLTAVETVARAAAAPSPQAIAAARVVLTERIAKALAAGQPFAEDFAALGVGGLPPEHAAPLQAVAAEGAASRAALLAEFRRLKTMLVRETQPAPSDWQGRLAAVAGRIVTITPVSGPASADPALLPQAIEAALGRDDVAVAARLWAELPEPARRASERFGAALRNRAAAEAAIAAVGRDAVAALGATR